MSSEFGKNIKVSIFGESHSDAIGMVLSGIDAGEEIDITELESFLARRAPGKSQLSTSRNEPDKPKVLSGLLNGKTTGTPLAVIVENRDVKSKDYENIRKCPRPSHSDYAAHIKYGEAHDIRGGGHFSGRLTAPLCIAGGICKQILSRKGITIGAHIGSIGNICDDKFDSVGISEKQLKFISEMDFPVINEKSAVADGMKDEILAAKENGDSVGGTIECCILGVEAGTGEPIFDGIENNISKAVFGIPAVKGIEFGSGFEACKVHGSVNNDPLYYDSDKIIKTKTNNNGGITGGLANGMPIIFNVAFKPTPSISIEQETVDLYNKENTTINIEGRHDPCIVPRAVPCVEAAAAVAILDLIME